MEQQVKDYWKKYKNFIIGGALFLLIVVIWSWCSADSEINLPKAENHAANANKAVEQSETQINAADESAARADALEAPKREAIKKAEKSRAKFEQNKEEFKWKKKEYEEFQNKTVVVSSDNLDERERRLLSDLDGLYPANR